MPRVHDFLALIDDPELPALVGKDPADEALLSMLVHLSFSDGLIHEDELALLQRVRPGASIEELLGWVDETSDQPMDWDALARVCTSPEEGLACLRFATRMACMDGEITGEERDALRLVEEVLNLPEGSHEACLDEVLAVAGEIDEERVRRALMSMEWHALYPARGALQGPLGEVVPEDATPLATMSDQRDQEVAGLYLEGLAADFATGANFVRWTDVAHYTRCPVPGANTHLTTKTGFKLSIPVSSPLRDLGKLLDLIYGRAELAGR